MNKKENTPLKPIYDEETPLRITYAELGLLQTAMDVYLAENKFPVLSVKERAQALYDKLYSGTQGHYNTLLIARGIEPVFNEDGSYIKDTADALNRDGLGDA